METNDLVQKAKNGDAEAFGLLYDAFAQRIFRFIKLKIQNQQDAEDALQEVFVKAHRGLTNLKVDNLNFSAWLYKIASNTINDKFRKQYRTPEIVSIEETLNLADKGSLQKNIEISSEVENVVLLFEELPTLYKQVLELRFIQDLSLEEVSKILKKSNLSVRLIQYRALKKVKNIMKKK